MFVVLLILVLEVVSAVPRQKRGTFCIMHGQDYSHGENFTIARSGPCVVYNCNHGLVRPIQLECNDGSGGCHPQGTEKEFNCKTAICAERGNTIGFYVTHTKCRDPNGDCHTIGETWIKDCQQFVCRKTGPSTFRIRTLGIQCQDAYGNCKNFGESFSYVINNQLYRECTCNLLGTRLRYECA
ncbi:hypothetical protein LOTGIDRAFT_230688 [Lottia gigantea]|uniref:Uncharacterized protein n=1 Tax=Lottia gigantea TaxID=225164 RepID=V4ABQ7_LOTGI|nr:hypothetical protein LOTGIDRAFT_230688 [Lottia gigantea]ESP01404.1 hypothetical protein LOTGIDRAFT_230688 [Lottia gigantea]